MAKIKVCGTTANLGPGFDCIGAALNIYSEIIIEEIDSGFDFIGYDEISYDENLIYKAAKFYFDYIDYKLKGLRIIEKSDIPSSRGLGSSAACIVAGITGAMIIAKGTVDKELLLDLATKMEGHPDNVAPAIYGGVVVAVETDGKVLCNTINLDNKLRFYALVPTFKLQTSKARAALPKEISYKDCVFNIGRSSFLVSTFANRKYEDLKYAMEDKIHQTYRKYLINNFDKVFDAAYEAGAKGVYLSGAGPTIMAIADEDIEEKLRTKIENISKEWDVKSLSLDLEGVKFE